MPDFSPERLNYGGGHYVSAETTATAAANTNTFINGGSTLLVMYGGNGTAGGYDVTFDAKKALESGIDENLVIKCGAAATNQLSLAYGFKPRDWNEGDDRVRFNSANVAVRALPVKSHANVGFVSGVSYVENCLPSGSLVGGDPSIFVPNDETTFIVVEGKSSNAGTLRIRGVARDSDSNRLGEISVAVPTTNHVIVAGTFTSQSWGSQLEITNTGAGSTSFKFVAFSARLGAIVGSS